MELFMSEPTAHEAFSLMLLERIERVEKENEMLQEMINNFQLNFEYYQKFHTLKFVTKFKCKYSMDISHKVEDIVNLIMKQRILFQPLFSFWEYTVIDTNDPDEDSRYHIAFTMYIHISISASIFDFKNWLDNKDINIQPIYGNIYELKLIIQYLMSWHVGLPYSSEDHKVEIWKRGGTMFEEELDPIMNTELFMSSSNYIASEELQKEYFRLVQYNEWKELFYD